MANTPTTMTQRERFLGTARFQPVDRTFLVPAWVYRRIIDAGKFVLSWVEHARISEMVRVLGPKYMKRIWIITTASDPEEAKAVIRILNKRQP